MSESMFALPLFSVGLVLPLTGRLVWNAPSGSPCARSDSEVRNPPAQLSQALVLYCNMIPSKENPVLDQSKAPNIDWLPKTIYCRPAFTLKVSSPAQFLISIYAAGPPTTPPLPKQVVAPGRFWPLLVL